MVEQAVGVVLDQGPREEQADLLSIVGVFAEPIVRKERFIQIVGKERLMTSDLLSYLVDERVAELQATYLQQIQKTLEEAVIARFPNAPIALLRAIRRINDSVTLLRLIISVIQTSDLAEFERQLAQAAAAS